MTEDKPRKSEWKSVRDLAFAALAVVGGFKACEYVNAPAPKQNPTVQQPQTTKVKKKVTIAIPQIKEINIPLEEIVTLPAKGLDYTQYMI